MTIYQKLIKQLGQTSELINGNGDLKRSIIIDRIKRLDDRIIQSMLNSPELRSVFFEEVKSGWVFKQDLFVEFLNCRGYLNYNHKQLQPIDSVGGPNIISDGEVVLNFSHKNYILEDGQSRAEGQRPEVFLNKVSDQTEIARLLEPKILSCGTNTNNLPLKENLLIEGNNLLALYCLRPRYQNQIKLIYIDPPYNTDAHIDKFNHKNSFKHSTWLTFMKNRLEVAKELLTDDGLICIAIDHYELGYLIVLTDEIFDRDNRLGIISIVHNPRGRQRTQFCNPTNEFLLIYAKKKAMANFQTLTNMPPNKHNTKLKTHWDNERHNAKIYGVQYLEHLIGVNDFPFPKSIHLMVDILKIMTTKDDIVLDFFAGSGTTGDAVLRLNREDGGQRKFILVEQLNDHITICAKRLDAVLAKRGIADRYTHIKLKKLNPDLINQVKSAKTTTDLEAIYQLIKNKSPIRNNLDFIKKVGNWSKFYDLRIKDQRQTLLDILDQNQLYMNLSALGDQLVQCQQNEIQFTKNFYGLN